MIRNKIDEPYLMPFTFGTTGSTLIEDFTDTSSEYVSSFSTELRRGEGITYTYDATKDVWVVESTARLSVNSASRSLYFSNGGSNVGVAYIGQGNNSQSDGDVDIILPSDCIFTGLYVRRSNEAKSSDIVVSVNGVDITDSIISFDATTYQRSTKFRYEASEFDRVAIKKLDSGNWKWVAATLLIK